MQKQASYGCKGGPKLYCVTHKAKTMVLLKKQKRCVNLKCTKPANYGVEGLPALFCKEHKEDGMICLPASKLKKCEECTTRTRFGFLRSTIVFALCVTQYSLGPPLQP